MIHPIVLYLSFPRISFREYRENIQRITMRHGMRNEPDFSNDVHHFTRYNRVFVHLREIRIGLRA